MVKRITACLVIFVILALAGCRNYRLRAEHGSEWCSLDSMFFMEIINGNYAIGSLVIDNKTTEIECHFGPSKTEFVVFVLPKYSPNPSDGDAWLFRGDYHYDEDAGTITLDITQDQIGLGMNEIVLYKTNV